MMRYITNEITRAPDGSALEVRTERVRVVIWNDGDVMVCQDKLLGEGADE